MELVVFRRELARRGLGVSGLGRHRTRPEVVVVFLAGPVKRWHKRSAVGVIAQVPGVVAATESVTTPAVVLVRMNPDHPDEGVEGITRSSTNDRWKPRTGADLPARARWGANWSDVT